MRTHKEVYTALLNGETLKHKQHGGEVCLDSQGLLTPQYAFHTPSDWRIIGKHLKYLKTVEELTKDYHISFSRSGTMQLVNKDGLQPAAFVNVENLFRLGKWLPPSECEVWNSDIFIVDKEGK